MIWTVFPKSSDELPQDFATENAAKKYAEELDCEYDIEKVVGDEASLV